MTEQESGKCQRLKMIELEARKQKINWGKLDRIIRRDLSNLQIVQPGNPGEDVLDSIMRSLKTREVNAKNNYQWNETSQSYEPIE